MYAVIPNPPVDRLEYIAKTYSKQPWIVLDMVDAVANTVGEGYWFESLRSPSGGLSDELRKQLSVLSWADDNSIGRQATMGRPSIAPKVTEQIRQAARSEPLAKAVVATLRSRAPFNEPTPADKAFSWMATQLAKIYKGGDLEAYTDAVQQFKQRGTAIGQWVQDTKPDLTKMGFDEVISAVDEFSPSEEKPPTQYDAVYKFADGWTVQKLPGNYCEEEADYMQHCGTAERRGSALYSIRDKGGYPHVTIEYQPHTKEVVQVKGKQNQPPIAKYQKYADEFLKTLPRLHPKIEALLKVVREDSSSGHDEEYDLPIAIEWHEHGFDAYDLQDWLRVGLDIGRSDVAQGLAGEHVTPGEFGSFPYPVIELIEYQGEGFDTDLVSIARIYQAMGGRTPVRRQIEFEFAAPKKKPLAVGRFKDSEGFRQMPSDERQRLLEAQDWVDAQSIAGTDEGPWVLAGWWSRGFTTDEFIRWSERGIVDSATAEGLVSFGVGAHDLADVKIGRWYGVDPTDVRAIVDAVEKKKLKANGAKRRTSVRVARKTSRR